MEEILGMKSFLRILLFLLIVLTAVVAFKIMKADKILQLEKTAVMDASPEAIFAQINNLQKWDNWSTWNQMDPNMEKEYAGPSVGVGSSYSWNSEKNSVGQGSMKITESIPNESLKMALDFGENGSATSAFTLTPTDSGTQVTWSFLSDDEESKATNAMMEMLLSSSYKKGLSQLEAAAMADPNPEPIIKSRLSDVMEIDQEKKFFLGIPHKGKTTDDFSAVYAEHFPKVYNYAAENNIKILSMPSCSWKVYDVENNVAEMVNGLFVPWNAKPPSDMVLEVVPAGKYLMINHYGPYEQEESAHVALAEHAVKNKVEIGMPISIYANDPTTVDPSEIKTEIYYPIL